MIVADHPLNPIIGILGKLQIPIWIVRERVGCILGIEPNEHQIPRFQGKYSYHTDHSENLRDPILPMSPYC